MYQTSILEWALIFISLIIILAFYIKNKNPRFINKKLIFLVLCLFSLLIFLKTLDDVLTSGAITKLDSLISTAILSIWNPSLNEIILFATQIINYGIILLLIFLTLYFIKTKKINRAILILLGSGIAFLSENIIKFLTKIARPDESLIKAIGYSFPSGHATVAAATLSLIIYCFYDLIKNKKSKLFFVLINILIILFVGFTRLYLNVHEFSDVLAGFALGIFISSVLILIFPARAHKAWQLT